MSKLATAAIILAIASRLVKYAHLREEKKKAELTAKKDRTAEENRHFRKLLDKFDEASPESLRLLAVRFREQFPKCYMLIAETQFVHEGMSTFLSMVFQNLGRYGDVLKFLEDFPLEQKRLSLVQDS
jgi:hypothetical protein